VLSHPSGEITLRIDAAASQRDLALAPFHTWRLPGGSPWAYFFRGDPDYVIRFPGIADFSISADGRDVRCAALAGVEQGTLDHLFINQVRPLARSRAGELVLHASAVALDSRRCVAFAAPSGRGKSTLAASFARAGMPMLTDDALTLATDGGDYFGTPGHPSVRLWEDASRALIPAGAPVAPPVEYTPKARFGAHSALPFCREQRRLACIFLLGESQADIATERVAPSAAVMGLVANSFLLDIDQRDALAEHFDELSRIAGRLPLFRLDYPRRFEDLARVRRAVVECANANCIDAHA
jgi:hypothetical protein